MTITDDAPDPASRWHVHITCPDDGAVLEMTSVGEPGERRTMSTADCPACLREFSIHVLLREVRTPAPWADDVVIER